MKRTVIIAKCIGKIESSNRTLLTFDRPLSCLCSKFVYIKDYAGVLLPTDIIEIFASIDIEPNKPYKITVYPQIESVLNDGQWLWDWDVIHQSLEDNKEETVLLWKELGSLANPSIEEIDLYIEELNKRT